MDEKDIKQYIADCVGAAFAKADSEREEREKAKADAEEEAKKKADAEEEEKAKADAEKEEEEAKEKAKADAEEEEEKAKADARFKAMSEEIAALKARVPVQLSDSDRDAVSAAIVKADSVFAAFGERAPVALSGENATQYRARTLNVLKQYSPTFKGSEISSIADSATLDLVERTIFADAQAAARSGETVTSGLREIITNDGAGRRVSTFIGNISSTFAPFSTAPRRVSAFNS